MILAFFKKNILVLIGVIVLVILLVMKLLKNKPSDKEQAANDVISSFGGINEDNIKRLSKLARDVAHNLGTAYDWYDPRFWTENDEKVFDLLKGLSQSEFDVISKAYTEVYAKGKTLSSDLAKLLDAKYYQQLSF